MRTLRERLSKNKFTAVNINYLLALSETHEGMVLVSNLVDVYLEHAPELIFRADACVKKADYLGAQSLMITLGMGSERIGAASLAKIVTDYFIEESSRGPDQRIHQLLCDILVEFETLQSELNLLSRTIRTLGF